MKVIGTDKNGDEIAEVSATELDTMFKEIRNMAIDEFISELYKIGEHREFDWEDIYKLADQLKGGAV